MADTGGRTGTMLIARAASVTRSHSLTLIPFGRIRAFTVAASRVWNRWPIAGWFLPDHHLPQLR